MLDEQDIYNNLPFSADEGWAQMQALLNKKLPVKKDTASEELFSLLPVVFLSTIFLFLSLQVSKDVSMSRFPVNELYTSSTTTVSSFAPGSKENGRNNRSNSNIAFVANKMRERAYDDEDKTGTTNELSITDFQSLQERVGIENIKYSHDNMNSNIAITPVANQRISPMTMVPGKTQQPAKRWELSAGIGVNIAAGKHQNLQPYPVATIRYDLSPRVFIAGGLSLFSPAPGNIEGISKTTYVNDTSNNIRLYNEVVKYDNLRYADILLSVGVNINKKLSLQAGMQASFLVSKKEKRSLQPYDFQMNSIDMAVNPAVIGLAANPQDKFDVGVRNIDWRFITGLKYKFGKMSAGMFYQQGLGSVGIGNTNGKNNTKMFTLNLLYQLK